MNKMPRNKKGFALKPIILLAVLMMLIGNMPMDSMSVNGSTARG